MTGAYMTRSIERCWILCSIAACLAWSRLTVDMIRKITDAWKIPADLLVRPYHMERAA